MINLVIRQSRVYMPLILTCNCEKVYRVFLDNQEHINNMDYDIVSDYFNKLEKELNNQY